LNGEYPDIEGETEREDAGGVLAVLLSFCSMQPDKNNIERRKVMRSFLIFIER